MPHLPVHYPNAIDLFFGLLSKFCSPGIAWAFGSFSEEDTDLSFWTSPHFGAWYDGYDNFDRDSSHDGPFCAKSQLQGQTFSKESPHSKRLIFSSTSECELCFC